MAYFSHSKISTFEQCKYKYKLQYIDKVKVEIPTTIEAFMGSTVHKALEKLYYTLINYGRVMTKKDVVRFYLEEWKKNFSDDILIVNNRFNADDYKNQGIIYILDYYKTHFPFRRHITLAVETQDKIKLGQDYYHIRIDRLDTDGRGTYLVCDYKTSSRMKTPEEVKQDRQLYMYSLWIKERYDKAKKVKLLWHMLKFNKDILVDADYEQAEKVKEEVIKKIKEIKRTREFPANKSVLCKWCIYKDICPYYHSDDSPIEKHSEQVESILSNLKEEHFRSETTIQNKLRKFF